MQRPKMEDKHIMMTDFFPRSSQRDKRSECALGACAIVFFSTAFPLFFHYFLFFRAGQEVGEC